MPTFPEIIDRIDLYPVAAKIFSAEGIEVLKISSSEIRVSYAGITHTYTFLLKTATPAGA